MYTYLLAITLLLYYYILYTWIIRFTLLFLLEYKIGKSHRYNN